MIRWLFKTIFVPKDVRYWNLSQPVVLLGNATSWLGEAVLLAS